MAFLPKRLQPILPRTIVLLLLLVLVTIGAVPGYMSGNWRWEQVPAVQGLKQLKHLKSQGLTLPGWQTLNHQVLDIGGHSWSAQVIQRSHPFGSKVAASTAARPETAFLLLLPQLGHTEQPQVEWMDIKGWQRWTTDDHRRLTLVAALKPAPRLESGKSIVESDKTFRATVEAVFFRGWTTQQTYAVVQWYAMPQGGHPSPSRWFWADRAARWQGRRVPWVAVSLLLPIEPLGEIETVRSLAQSLTETVQSSLMQTPFQMSL